jgi:glycosyltransferase involved in cell wall biosynthesis
VDQAVYVGRFTTQKNTVRLARTWVSAVHPITGVRLVLAGAGIGTEHEAEDTVRALAAAHPEALQVTVLGADEERADLLARSDMFVSPSLFDHLPQAMMEAVSAGVPVIATDVPGHRDAIVDGETGRLCDVALERLPDLVQGILRDPRDSREMARRARRRAVEAHSQPATAARLIEVIRSMTCL